MSHETCTSEKAVVDEASANYSHTAMKHSVGIGSWVCSQDVGLPAWPHHWWRFVTVL
jgi:hypothetical protein